MADRSVTVRLRVSSAEFNAGMLKAGTSVKILDAEIEKAGKHARTHSDGMQKLGKASLVAGGVMGAAMLGATKIFADFDKQMSSVRASTMANAAQMAQLRDAAVELGAKTAFSATEAAQGEEELAKAGVSVTSIVHGGLAGALNLAAAGGTSVANAANIAATALTVFGLKGSDVGHVADLLAAGAGKAQGSVDDLGLALKYVGPVAAGMGISVESTVGVLAEFASQGMIADQAGTSFRGLLLSLTSPSVQAKNEMAKLGITLYDSSGKFLGMENAAGQLQKGLGDLTPQARDAALGILFGNDQVTAARVLYSQGAEGVRKWTKSVDDAGYASKQAAARMDNLQGDLDQLGGAFQSAIIGNGTGANSVLRSMAQHLTNDVNALAGLPDGLQKAGIGMAAIGTGGLAAVGVLGTLLPKIDNLKSSLMQGGAMSQRLAGATGFLKGGLLAAVPILGLAGAALDYWGQKTAEHKSNVDSLTQAILADNGALGANVRANLAKRASDAGLFDLTNKVGISQKAALDSILGMTRGTDELTAAQRQLHDVWSQSNTTGGYITVQGRKFWVAAQDAKKYDDELSKMRGDLKGAAQDAKDQAAAIGQNGKAAVASATATTSLSSAQEQMAISLGLSTVGMSEQTTAGQLLGMAIDRLSGKALSAASAEDAFRQAVFGLSDSMKQNGQTFDQNTREGLANHQQVIAAITAANAHAQAVADRTNSVKAGTAALRTDLERLRDTVPAGTAARAVLESLIKSFGQIPVVATSTVNLHTQQANSALAAFITRMQGLHDKTVHIGADTTGAVASIQRLVDTPTTKYVQVVTLNGPAPSGGRAAIDGRAEGGWITGPGTGTSDDVPFMGSNGEFVFREAVARKNRGLFEEWNRTGRIPRNVPAYAGGGSVGRAKDTPHDVGRSVGRGLGQAVIEGVTSATPNLQRAMALLAKAASDAFDVSRIRKQLEVGVSKLADLRGARAELASNVTSGVQGGFDVSTAGADESTGYIGSAAYAIKGMQAKAASNKKVYQEVALARSKGANADLLAEFAEKGDTEGLARFANASRAQIGQYNSAYAAQQKYAGLTGQLVGSAKYDSSIRSQAAANGRLQRELVGLRTDLTRVGRSIVDATGRPVRVEVDNQGYLRMQRQAERSRARGR